MEAWNTLLLASAMMVTASGQIGMMGGNGPMFPFWPFWGGYSNGQTFAAGRDLDGKNENFIVRIFEGFRTIAEVLKRIPDVVFPSLYLILYVAFPLKLTQGIIEGIQSFLLAVVQHGAEFLLLPSRLPIVSIFYCPIALIIRVIRFVLSLIINIIGTPLAALVAFMRKVVTACIGIAHTVVSGVLNIPMKFLNLLSPAGAITYT